MDSDTKYWIWIQQALGYGNKKISNIIEHYKGAKDFYNAGLSSWKSFGIFSNLELEKLNNFDFKKIDDIIINCKNLNQTIISYNDDNYPLRLKHIFSPPCVLYVKGNFPKDFNDRLTISIVGTRLAADEALSIAFDFSFDLANKGVIIVSGGALGIDSAAHKGALYAKGETVLISGCGLDVNYPKENDLIRKKILDSSCIISEFISGIRPLPRNFPIRNRLISGISLGTFIIQAGERSGALITANLAIEQNRDLFVIPGNIRNKLYEGNNNLIKNGAIPVTSPIDILEEYKDICVFDFEHDNSIKKDDKILDSNIEIIEKLCENSKNVYNVLTNQKISIDDICIKCNLSINFVLQALTELEIFGLVESYSGRMYTKLKF